MVTWEELWDKHRAMTRAFDDWEKRRDQHRATLEDYYFGDVTTWQVEEARGLRVSAENFLCDLEEQFFALLKERKQERDQLKGTA